MDDMPDRSETQVLEFVVSSEQAGQRLDRFLAAQLPTLSRNRIQSLMEDGHILAGGVATKPAHRIEAGESVTVGLPAPCSGRVEPEPIPLDILYEDADLAVINKPAGMIVHPGAGAESGTLVAALLHHFGAGNLGRDKRKQGGDTTGLSSVGGPLRPGIVHRLDKETSGAIVVARTDAAHAKLATAFSERLVEKTYIALLHGNPRGESGRIELPVARDLRRRSRMTTRRREGREARTDWRALAHIGNFALVKADLHTGRTHQIRVHFSALGCPVVGDTIYGAPREERIGRQALPALGRNFLHAARITFAHPRTGERLEFRAPLAAELVDYLRAMCRGVGTPVAAIDAVVREYL